jgi:LPXTG-motif cell wall-anchored protein
VATATPVSSVAPSATPAAPAASAAPVTGLPNTATVDGSASLLLGGFLLILTGALVIGSRRSIPTER